MKPTEKFADYNKDVILGNMIQAETHLKNISDTSDPNFSACANKHLLESETLHMASDSANAATSENLEVKKVDTQEVNNMTLAEMEKGLIIKTLNTVEWNRTRAAGILGISVRTLRNKLKEYGTILPV